VASQRALIYNNLFVMLDAGLPILRTLPAAISGMKGRLPNAFKSLAKEVSNGASLAETMGKQPGIFTPIEVLVTQAGEMSGNLPECLKLLSGWYSFCDRLKHIVVSGMMLPCLLIFLAAFIGPATPLFLGRIDINQYFVQAVMTLLLFYGPIAVVLAIVFLTPAAGIFRRMLDSIVFIIPVLGKAVFQLALSRYCRIFYMLFKGGVPVVQCAKTASEHTGNFIVTKMLAGGTTSAIAGSPVSEGFSRRLPGEFLELWRIGEESGELDNVVERLVENTSEESERIFTELAKWIPKLIYCLVSIYIMASIFRNFSMIQ